MRDPSARPPPRAAPRRAALAALLVLTAALVGCQEPGEAVAERFETLAVDVEAAGGECAAAAAVITDHLTREGEALRAGLGESDSAAPPVARRVFMAGQRIDAALEPCAGDAAVRAARVQLASLILEATGAAADEASAAPAAPAAPAEPAAAP